MASLRNFSGKQVLPCRAGTLTNWANRLGVTNWLGALKLNMPIETRIG
jgi:hypothetical protein